MRKIRSFSFEGLKIILVFLFTWVLINSALDIYNNFAYDKAILRDSPYGGVYLLADPGKNSSSEGYIKSGEYVYVEDWLSAVNGRVEFAKVRSKLKEGYINKELLVQTNINVIPIFSILLLCFIFFIYTRKLYYKLSA